MRYRQLRYATNSIRGRSIVVTPLKSHAPLQRLTTLRMNLRLRHINPNPIAHPTRMLHLQLRSTIRAREQAVKTSRAPHAAAPVQTPSPTNATRERYPPRSTHDTGSIRASHALSHHERSHMPHAPPQSLKTSYSEPREARSHDTRDRARGAGQSATSNGKAARTTRITVTRHQRNSSRTRRKQKAPRRWQYTTSRALTERATVSLSWTIITHLRDARTTAPQRGSR